MSSHDPSRSGPLRRWAGVAVRHPWRVIGGWIAFIALIGVLAGTVGGSFADEFAVPGTESQEALDTLVERFPAASGDSAQVVFRADATAEDPAVTARINAFLTEAATLPEVVGVTSPYDAGTIAPDGTIAYATIQYADAGVELEEGSVDRLLELVQATNGEGLQAEVGGQVVNEIPETRTSEIVGLIAAIIVLTIMFGSVVAMGLPVLTAIAGVGTSVLITLALASVFDFSTLTTALLSMMGLGVGIDYALFIITRFREERAAGRQIQPAAITAVDTAGRAVLFAGSVVVVALLGLFAIGIPFIGFLGLGGAIAVFMSMAIAVGLLPSLLALTGGVMDRWAFVPNRQRPTEQTFGYRLTRRIQRAPAAWLIGALVILGTLAAPAVFGAHLGSADASTNPADSSSRKAYDLIAEGFGSGANGPLLIVLENRAGLDPAAMDSIAGAIGGTANVTSVTPPMPNEDGTTAVMQAIPATAPQDTATEDLIATLRSDVLPAATAGTGIEANVGGSTASFADLASTTSDRLPLYILLVAGLSMLILMAVFRSIVIPLKAVAFNLISFYAGFGILVAVFQEGFLGLNELFGVDRTGPIESFLPVFLFAILFGLSMDYEIFLVSRVHESWSHRRDNGWALRHGIGESGRVVLAAGAIMTSVFLAFTLGEARAIKEIGLGLGSAILVDVLLVRMILVPAFMSIVGARNWWFPSWLNRIVPRLDVEGTPNAGAAAAD